MTISDWLIVIKSFTLSVKKFNWSCNNAGVPGLWVTKCEFKIIWSKFLMDPFSFPRLDKPQHVASKCKFIWNSFRHRNVSILIRARWNSRRACSTLSRSPHSRTASGQAIFLEGKRVWGDQAECWWGWTNMGKFDPSKPFRVNNLATGAGRTRRWKEWVVLLSGPPRPRRLLVPLDIDSWRSGGWRAQRRCDRSTDGATVEVEVGKLGRRCWRWSSGEVFEPWNEGVAISIRNLSIRGWRWTWEGWWARAWIVGSTWTWMVRWARACCCWWSTNYLHALWRLASLIVHKIYFH